MRTQLLNNWQLNPITRSALIFGLVTFLVCVAPPGISRAAKKKADTVDLFDIDIDSSPLINLLSRDFTVVDLENPGPPFDLVPVVIGAAALDHPEIMAFVIQVYRAGLTVAIAHASQDEANKFDALVEGEQGASCLPAENESEIALYAIQQTLRDQPRVASRYCLPDFVDINRRTRRAERRWLQERFASTPTAPLQAVEVGAAGPVNLDSLSQKVHCSELAVNGQGQVQADLFLTSLRSFDQERDYYYVNNFVQFVPRVSNYSLSTAVSRPIPSGGSFNDLLGTGLLFTEPATTVEAVSQYTNSRSTTVSGGVGFMGLTPNVQASVSVTVGTQTTVTVPPVTILNTSNLASATPSWTFQQANPVRNALFDTATGFLWFIDRDIYESTGEEINELFSFFDASISPNFVTVHGTCGYPLPFPTFEVGAPQVTSVDPTSVQRGGGTFLIRGEQMYPGIVSNVLLGGDALPSANFVPIDDKDIRVVVPGSQKKGMTPVQVNTFFGGTTLPSNSDVMVNLK